MLGMLITDCRVVRRAEEVCYFVADNSPKVEAEVRMYDANEAR